MVALYHKNRSVFKLTGPDMLSFLQGVITNDMETLAEKGILYTVMLTSKGRFHFEFFLYQDPEDKNSVFLDTPAFFSGDLFKRLKIFKLRSDVVIEDLSESVKVVTYHDEIPSGEFIFQDPRCEELGHRGLVFGEVPQDSKEDDAFYNKLCLQNCIPRAGHELIVEKTIPLEANLEELGVLSFTKGCYLGQELTARTKHQGLVRKKLYPVKVEGNVRAEMLSEGIVIYQEDQKIGVLLSAEQGLGIAKLRIEDVQHLGDFTAVGVLKETKTDCCKIRYSPHK